MDVFVLPNNRGKMKNVYSESGRLMAVVSDFDGDGSVWDEEKNRKERREREKGKASYAFNFLANTV